MEHGVYPQGVYSGEEEEGAITSVFIASVIPLVKQQPCESVTAITLISQTRKLRQREVKCLTQPTTKPRLTVT